MSAAAETTTDIAPDLVEAERFLTLLDETAEGFDYRTIFPSGGANKYRGSLDDVAPYLERDNRAGAGIYVVVNETDGQGQKKANITRIRAIWQEDDSGDAPALPLEPHIVVQSSPGKYHRYLLTDGAPLDEFEPVQRRMVDDFGSDPDAKDRARVLRLPGFFHRKDPDNSHMVRIIHESGAQSYDWQTVTANIPPVGMKSRSEAPEPSGMDTADLERILAHIPNDDVHYGDWLKVGMAIHHETGADSAGFRLWINWSAKSDKHDDSEMRAKWESFGKHDSVVTIGTLIWMAKQNGYKPASTASTSRLAERLAKQIQDRLCAELNIDPEESPETADSLQVDAAAIDRMLNRSFWSGSKSKLFILNDDNGVNQYTEKDAWSFLSRACGAAANREAIVGRALVIQPPGKAQDKAQKEAARIASIPRTIIMSELKWTNQRDHVQWRVDMFAQAPTLDLREDAARITLPHIPFPDYGKPDPSIIADYKAHFPELDAVLRMIVAARFAGDRKRAYLWLLASSDWGKGFFTDCLGELGLVVEMSVKEIERVFEGSPAGKRPEEFKRAWVLAVNEFKSVKSEIKQLESHMQIAPKNQLTSEVELFAKLFMSAENVASLITDHGIEDQFAQRFSLIDKRGHSSIDDQTLFRQDSGAYRRAVVAYMAQAINRRVREYRQLGREESDRQSSAVLRDFHQCHGLANFAPRFSESMVEVAEEFREYMDHDGALSKNWQHSLNFPDRLYLRNATADLEEFLRERKPSDQVATIKRRKDDIFVAVSVDGRGYASHKPDGPSFRAVRFR